MKKGIFAFIICFFAISLIPGVWAETLPENAYISMDEVQASGYSPTVDAKVAAIVQECKNAGVAGEYNIALWLHDWLIYNANYDDTYTNFGPEGVLLYGRGVCSSYSAAYQLLLDEFGIECKIVESPEMNHAWNMVKIDGQWCHVDCTFDDPIGGDGENRQYFGLTDTLIKRDHKWDDSATPEATSLQNNYMKRNHLGGTTQEEINDVLNAQAAQKLNVLEICYLGDDPDFKIDEAVQCWYFTYNWKYGLSRHSAHISGYHEAVTMEYTAPWEKPQDPNYPVKCPDFTLTAPEGEYSLSSYRNNGLVLVMGRTYDMNTHHLMERLSAELSSLHSQGVEVILNCFNVTNLEKLEAFRQQYPGFVCTYNAYDVCSQLRRAVESHDGSAPQVFVIDKTGMIVHYAYGFNPGLEDTISKMHEVATGAPLPAPTKPELQNTLNADLLAAANGSTAKQLVQIAKQNKGTLFLQFSSAYEVDENAEKWEANAALCKKLGLKLVICVHDDYTGDLTQYPDVTMLEDDGNIMIDVARAVNRDFSEGIYYSSSTFLDSRGYVVEYFNGKLVSGMEAIAQFAYTMPMESAAPNKLTTIDSEAFSGSSIATLDLSKSGVTSIAGGAFANCTKLTIIRLPDAVTIADNAFTGCKNLIILADYGTSGYRYAVAHGFDVISRY